jgi:hypothetical protein
MALFQKGQSGNFKGRPVGIKNKVKPLNVIDIYESRNFDPIHRMIDMVENPDVKDRTKAKLLADLANFVVPKLRSTEVTFENESHLTLGVTLNPKKLIKDGI